MNISNVFSVEHARQLRTSYDAAVSSATVLLLCSEGALELSRVERKDHLDTVFAFLEEMNDELPKT